MFVKRFAFIALLASTVIVWLSVAALKRHNKRMSRLQSARMGKLIVLSQAIDSLHEGREYELKADAAIMKVKERLNKSNTTPTSEELIDCLMEVNTNLVYSNRAYKEAAETLISTQTFPNESNLTTTSNKEN